MKRIIYLILPLLLISLVACNNESNNDKSSKQYYSEEFVDEEAVSKMDTKQIVISFNHDFDVDKSQLADDATMEEVKEFLKNHRKQTKEYFSQYNKLLFDSMELSIEKEKVYISNYSNLVFIELDENKSDEYYEKLLLEIKNYDFVQSAYIE